MRCSRQLFLALVLWMTGCAFPDLADEAILRDIERRTLAEFAVAEEPLNASGGVAVTALSTSSAVWTSDAPPDSSWRALHATIVKAPAETKTTVDLAGVTTPDQIKTKVATELSAEFKVHLSQANCLVIQPKTDGESVKVVVDRLTRVRVAEPVSDNWLAITVVVEAGGTHVIGPISLSAPSTAQAVVDRLYGDTEFRAHCTALADGANLVVSATSVNAEVDVRVARRDAGAWNDALAELRRRQEKYREFLGFNFGLGVGFSTDVQGPRRVEKAEVRNNIVRVEKEREALPRILLETHILLVPDASFLGIRNKGTWGIGPFMGIQASSEEVLDAFAAGVMMGLRREDMSQSLNVGVGAILDSSVKVLGRGLRDGMPLPPGETTVRTREEDRWGVGVFFSIGF